MPINYVGGREKERKRERDRATDPDAVLEVGLREAGLVGLRGRAGGVERGGAVEGLQQRGHLAHGGADAGRAARALRRQARLRLCAAQRNKQTHVASSDATSAFLYKNLQY